MWVVAVAAALLCWSESLALICPPTRSLASPVARRASTVLSGGQKEALVTLSKETIAVGRDPPRTLIEDLDLEIRAGERWAVLGSNGCGKSMLAQFIGLSLSPDDSREVGSVAQRRELTRTELSLGFNELAELEKERRGGLAAAQQLVSSSAIPSAAKATAERSATYISFESHRRLLHDEAIEFAESRFSVVHKRATPASFLFPELYPTDPDFPTGYKGYRPTRSRLAPLPVPYDARNDDPLLSELEAGASTGKIPGLMKDFGLWDLRHRPIHCMSTGEVRKLMLLDFMLSKSKLLVLDEAFDGLDEGSRVELASAVRRALDSAAHSESAVVVITHREEDLAAVQPTHALFLGTRTNNDDAAAAKAASPGGGAWEAGPWIEMKQAAQAFFEAQQADGSREAERAVAALPRPSAPQPAASSRALLLARAAMQGRKGGAAPIAAATPTKQPAAVPPGVGEAKAALVEFRGVTVRYGATGNTVLNDLYWTLREGEKWALLGENGSGKSTVIDLITGENPLAYGKDIWLFGRRKGSGESIWEIKQQIGVLSTSFHMAYVDFADTTYKGAGGLGAMTGGGPRAVSTWEVVCSGFFDSVGLYEEVSLEQASVARKWIGRFGLDDLVTPPKRFRGGPGAAAGGAAARGDAKKSFFELSHGQQKLVLLCRALVKKPRLLLLDEPTHGLSGTNRARLLGMLKKLREEPDVALVYVTHRKDEVDALAFDDVLRLPKQSQPGPG